MEVAELQRELGAKYLQIAHLGRGGQGQTFSATSRDGAPVVIKVFDLRSARDWQDAKLFEREVAALQSLHHPLIPGCHGALELSSGARALIMDAVVGPSLDAYFAGHPRPDDCQWIIVDTCRALGALHALGLCHRDVKPQNLVVDGERHVHLIDFGAVGVDRSKCAGTSSTIVIGTPGFMAPEVQFGATPATDVYSLGITFMCAVTRRSPNQLPLHGLAVDVPRALPDASIGLQRLLEKMTAPEPSRRFQNASAVLEALRALVPAQPTKAGQLLLKESPLPLETRRPISFVRSVGRVVRTTVLCGVGGGFMMGLAGLLSKVFVGPGIDAYFFEVVAMGLGVGGAAGALGVLDSLLLSERHTCPHCSAPLRLNAHHKGKTAFRGAELRCVACGKAFPRAARGARAAGGA